ncbi:DUF4345 domain-containing protein [Halpernia sp.]|uniref:DUF4345 domain-containing protein n=1 Tax=Halpernia sp. TaxID=2782209 RepID=UPI003A8D37BB
MELILQTLLGLLAFICLLGGLNLLLKGSKSFLPESLSPQLTLDNLFRFLSGIYFGLGFLMVWLIFQVNKQTDIFYFIGIVVVFSGLGRLYSRTKVGSAGKYMDVIMVFEILLGITIIAIQYFR